MRLFSGIAPLLLAASLAGCFHKSAPRVSLTPLVATPKMVDSLWSEAMNLYNRHKWQKAAAVFDRVELELPPGDHRAMVGRLYLGDLYVRDGSYLQGVREYRRVVDEYPTDSLAPEALLKAANAYRSLWRAPDLDPTYGLTAQSVYSEVLTRYPASPAAAKAREKMTELDNWFAQKAYKAASFYVKWKAYDSAIIYYKALLIDYPKATIAPVALADLIAAYRKLGYSEDVRDMCALMQRDWAASPQFPKACPAAAPAAAEKPAGS
jgi:outer membrane protein assembly factor BamD